MGSLVIGSNLLIDSLPLSIDGGYPSIVMGANKLENFAKETFIREDGITTGTLFARGSYCIISALLGDCCGSLHSISSVGW